MTKPKFKLYRDKAGEWRWTLYATNGEPIAVSSEGYTRREAATLGIVLTKLCSAGANVIEPSLKAKPKKAKKR